MDTIKSEEPFRKRPRLSMFPSDEHLDEELGARRAQNDLLLKSRFESIFEKYAHDFTGVGDEIKMDDLTVVVNNGHLQSMENETDPGGLHNTKGQSLLRAMTEAVGADEKEYQNAGADEVINSIEEIAESAAMAEDQEETAPLDSDEELFLPLNTRVSYITPPDSRESQITAQSEMVDSDPESLFEAQQPNRSESPDSLFEVQPGRSSDSTISDPLPSLTIADEEVEDDFILQKFGPHVGREVLAIIQRAKDAAYQAHIEPAWRIPTSAVPPKQTQTISVSKTPSVPIPTPPEAQQILSPENAKSLWKSTKSRSTRRASQQARVMRRLRAESEDPLQEDFTNRDGKALPEQDDGDVSDWEAEQRPRKKQSTSLNTAEHIQSEFEDVFDWGEEEPPKRKKRADADDQVLKMRKGSCSYCEQQWTTRGGVFKHWVKLAALFDKGEVDDDDLHDLDYIHAYVASSQRAQKGPRLVINDFKTMVELHEGAGISFDEIAELRALRTKKNGLALNDVYDRYRNVSDILEDATKDWSADELRILHELCQNPKRDMGTFALQLDNRSNTDIGAKLAEIWLRELTDSGQTLAKAAQQQTKTPTKADRLQPERRKHEREIDIDELFFKQEPESDDELFGRS